jgi:hypothetical protein
MNPVVSPNSTGVALFSDNSGALTKRLLFAPWQLTAFGPTQSTTATGNFYNFMTSAASTTRDEAIQVGVTQDKNVSGAVWNGTSWTPIAISVGGTVVTNLGQKPSNTQVAGAAVAYMTGSGNAMLVWNTNGNKVSGVNGAKDLAYSIWNGTSWTPAGFVPVPTTVPSVAGQEPQNIQIAANPTPGSNELVMTVTYHNNVDVAFVWNGTSWGNPIQLETSNPNNGLTNVSVAYSQVSGQALVTYAVGATNNNNLVVGYRTWSAATGWSAQGTVPLPTGLPTNAGTPVFTVLASDPGNATRAATNNIVLGVQTSNHAAWMAIWNGTAWVSSTVGTTTGVSKQNNQNIAVAFESSSGQALAVYQNDVAGNATELQFNSWDPPPAGQRARRSLRTPAGPRPRSRSLPIRIPTRS